MIHHGHMALLARRRNRNLPAWLLGAVLSIILIEFPGLLIWAWHPWPEHGTIFQEETDLGRLGRLKWSDGSRFGCAEAYQPYAGVRAWHLDVYLGASRFGRVKSFELDTRQEVIDTASKWCK